MEEYGYVTSGSMQSKDVGGEVDPPPDDYLLRISPVNINNFLIQFCLSVFILPWRRPVESGPNIRNIIVVFLVGCLMRTYRVIKTGQARNAVEKFSGLSLELWILTMELG